MWCSGGVVVVIDGITIRCVQLRILVTVGHGLGDPLDGVDTRVLAIIHHEDITGVAPFHDSQGLDGRLVGSDGQVRFEHVVIHRVAEDLLDFLFGIVHTGEKTAQLGTPSPPYTPAGRRGA